MAANRIKGITFELIFLFQVNEKNYRIYSDKFRLSVLDLTQIDLATAEDRAYRIDRWAALFKATTWEELKMLANRNNSGNGTSQNDKL